VEQRRANCTESEYEYVKAELNKIIVNIKKEFPAEYPTLLSVSQQAAIEELSIINDLIIPDLAYNQQNG